MSLIIKTKKWGAADANTVLKILNSVQKTMIELFGKSIPGNIFIYQNILRGNPITLYEKSPCGAYKIELTATDSFWCQYIYQFSHEYCHVRTNYSTGNHRTKWFEESICELSSIYTLKKMAISWKKTPPFTGLEGFSDSIQGYVDDLMLSPTNPPIETTKFLDWFKTNLPALEGNQYLRDSNRRVALMLLPLFEEHKSLWNSMTHWNTWDRDEKYDIFSDLDNWIKTLPTKNKTGAKAIAEAFGLLSSLQG